jgi:hypothetical protein
MEDDWLILWRNRYNGLMEIEEFDNRAEAEAKLVEFSRLYPWNTYRLCRVRGRGAGGR